MPLHETPSPARGAVVRAAFLASVALGTLSAAASAATTRAVAVQPLAPNATTLPYAPLPQPNELTAMTARLRDGLRDGRLRLVPAAAVASALRRAGYDQRSAIRACVDAPCARAVGRAIGADVVVYGAVTRALAIVWGTHVYALDVRRGTVVADLQAGYKGDVTTMTLAESGLGGCVARVIMGRRRCPPDPGY